MGVRSYVLLQTFVLCAYTNTTMLANSETISVNSHTTSGNSYKMSDDSDKMSDASDKMSDSSYKMSNDSYKTSGDSYETSDSGYKMSDDKDKMSYNGYNMSDISEKMSDNSYKMSDDTHKVSYDSNKMSSLENNKNFLGLSPLYRLYSKCVGKDAGNTIDECLSTQVVVLMDEIVQKERIPLLDGIQLVRKQESMGRSISGEQMLKDEPLEAALPRDVDTRQGILNKLMRHKLFNFFKTNRLEIGLPSSRTVRGTCLQISIFTQMIWKLFMYLFMVLFFTFQNSKLGYNNLKNIEIVILVNTSNIKQLLNIYHHHHHKHQGLDPLIRSVSTVTAARANASSVFQLFSFLAVCSGMISNGFGFVAFFAAVKASSVCIHLSCPVCL